MARITAYTSERLALDPPPLDRSVPLAELQATAGQTITAQGMGGAAALDLFADVLAPACLSIDHPRYLSFVAAAPTEAASLFDMVVSVTSIYGGSWLEGSGAVYAENQALRWLSDLAGLPEGAGGTFVSGGSTANLSALAAARRTWRDRIGDARRPGGLVLVSSAAHSSIASALELLDLEAIEVPVDESDRLTRAALDDTIAGLDAAQRSAICAVVATAGLTNSGTVDDIGAAADAASGLGAWLHVDGAYGGAALCSSGAAHRFAGIQRADSVTIDPHKWLFAPYDCAAIIYRTPALARATFTQHAEYLDVLTDAGDWCPSDYAPHLTRRARGLPFWFSLAVHGTDAYREAIDLTLTVASDAAEMIRGREDLELVLEPELSIVVFRVRGWAPDDYRRWSDHLLAEEIGFMVPTTWRGEMVFRVCIVNPLTTVADIEAVIPSADEVVGWSR